MYYACMTVALQIRDVPDEVRDVIVARAALRGQSMQAYLLDLLKREARIARNAHPFQTMIGDRLTIPDEAAPERVIRQGREQGFDLDRDSEPSGQVPEQP